MKTNNSAPYLSSKRLYAGPDRKKADAFGKGLTNAAKKNMDGSKFKKDVIRKPAQKGLTTDDMA
ncbi:MAG: hypothetical protein WC262_11505 [Bacteroidales bacterium]|jgi:hypothetical protein